MKQAGYLNIGKKKLHFTHLIFICVGLVLIGYITFGSVESAIIAKKGTPTIAKIEKVEARGSKGVKHYYYRYTVKNKTFTGKALYLSNNVGDQVEILFLQNRPHKNRVKSRLEKTYGYFLRKNSNLTQD